MSLRDRGSRRSNHPNAVLVGRIQADNCRLDPTARLVAYVMGSFMNSRTRTCFASVALLARKAGLGRTAIKAARHRLTGGDAPIFVRVQGRGRTPEFRLYDDPEGVASRPVKGVVTRPHDAKGVTMRPGGDAIRPGGGRQATADGLPSDPEFPSESDIETGERLAPAQDAPRVSPSGMAGADREGVDSCVVERADNPAARSRWPSESHKTYSEGIAALKRFAAGDRTP
jgi:hypothetical protein